LAKRLRFDVKSAGELGAFVVLIVVFAILNPSTFLTAKNIQTILNQSAIPLIIAVGATLVILMGSMDHTVEGGMGAAGISMGLM
jgi:ribose transport system permease protein